MENRKTSIIIYPADFLASVHNFKKSAIANLIVAICEFNLFGATISWYNERGWKHGKKCIARDWQKAIRQWYCKDIICVKMGIIGLLIIGYLGYRFICWVFGPDPTLSPEEQKEVFG